jgi:predicted nucleic acid-binding protein
VDEIRAALEPIRSGCEVVPVTVETHDRALELAARHGWRIYEVLSMAAALPGECRSHFSQDLHDRQRGGRLRIVDPFAARS